MAASMTPTTAARASIVLAVLATGSIGRAETSELTLPALVAALRTGNPSVAAAARRHEAARVAIGRARALDDPSLSAMVEDLPLRVTGGMPMFRFQATQ